MIYKQATGELFNNSGELICKGYSGHGEGRNNPEMEHIKNVGCIPKGIYYIGGKYDSSKVGKYAIILDPDARNEMYGRDDFRIHGDSIRNPGTASHGCIIMPHSIRVKMYTGTDKIINVV